MNRIKQLFGIKYPIVQGGMIWCSGWVNIPLLYPNIKDHIQVIIDEGVKIVFTSAGSPKKYTSFFQDYGIKVAHVIANKKFAFKCVEAGVDAIVAEGFEAGGHNGIQEITSMCLIPMIRDVVDIPLIAAGGIADGRSIMAAMVLGADGVQMGSRFVASKECSAHINFKNEVINADEGETDLTLKELTAVRLLKNGFYNQIQKAYNENATYEQLKELLGKGRAKKGMFEGDLINGELEIGQVSAILNEILSVSDIMSQLVEGFEKASKDFLSYKL